MSQACWILIPWTYCGLSYLTLAQWNLNLPSRGNYSFTYWGKTFLSSIELISLLCFYANNCLNYPRMSTENRVRAFGRARVWFYLCVVCCWYKFLCTTGAHILLKHTYTHSKFYKLILQLNEQLQFISFYSALYYKLSV